MSSQRLLILVVVAILALGAGLWLAGRQASSVSGGARAALYPGLEFELDKVQAIRIFKAGDVRAVELKRGSGGWTVTERGGYRADEAKLRKLVRSIADARIDEEKTSDPERYAALGVEDTRGQEARGVRVELSGPAKPIKLIVGKTGPGASSSYVRRAGEKQSWLIDQALDVPSKPGAWLDKRIADIPPDRVQSVTVAVKGEKAYTVAKAARTDASFHVEKPPKGKSLRSPTIADDVASALSGLNLSDAQAASAVGPDPAADHASVRTFDGLVVELDGWRRGDKRLIALKPAFDGALAKRFAAAATGVRGKAPPANTEAEARSLAARTAGWVYEIPAWQYDRLFRPIKELV